MQDQSQSETAQLNLTKFAKSIFEGNDEFNLLKNPNEAKHFEPIPNSFYGFAIDMNAFKQGIEIPVRTIDIPYEDLTDQKFIENGK